MMPWMDLSCKHRWANIVAMEMLQNAKVHKQRLRTMVSKESRTPCKNAVNDSTIASSISWWQGWHLFHCISPMSLQDGKKNLYQTNNSWLLVLHVRTNSLSRRTLLQINLRQGIEEIICTAANTDGGVCLLPWHIFFKTTGQPALTR